MRKLYYSFISLLFILFLSQELYALDVSGTVSVNTTWGPEQVNVTGDVTISALLTIAPGTRIVVADQAMITVTSTGSVQANGTSGSGIVFTAGNPITGWRGLFFDSGIGDDPSSSFQYTTFEYGNADGNLSSTHEVCGGAVYASYHSGIEFDNCYFLNNKANKDGGAARFFESLVIFRNCDFSNNSANNSTGTYGVGGAIDLNRNSDGSVIVENCRFFNNSAYSGGAIFVENLLKLTIRGSIFANNEASVGGVLKVGDTDVVNLISNTFSNNLCKNSSYYAISLSQALSIDVSFINNIIYGNLSGGVLRNIEFVNTPSSAVFQNCLIEGGLASVSGLPASYTWTEIVDSDPAFVSASSDIGLAADGSLADWQLSDQSPCINAGSADVSGLGLPAYDLAGNPRIQQGRIDMGALESSFVPTTIVNRFYNVDFKLWYRRDAGQIVVRTDDHEYFTGALYNLTGALVDDKRPASFQRQMIFSAAGLNRGIYVVTLFSPNGKALKVAKVVVD